MESFHLFVENPVPYNYSQRTMFYISERGAVHSPMGERDPGQTTRVITGHWISLCSYLLYTVHTFVRCSLYTDSSLSGLGTDAV